MNELKKLARDLERHVLGGTLTKTEVMQDVANRLSEIAQTHVLVQTVPAGWKMVAVPIDPLCDGCSEAECDKCCPKGHCTRATEGGEQ